MFELFYDLVGVVGIREAGHWKDSNYNNTLLLLNLKSYFLLEFATIRMELIDVRDFKLFILQYLRFTLHI